MSSLDLFEDFVGMLSLSNMEAKGAGPRASISMIRISGSMNCTYRLSALCTHSGPAGWLSEFGSAAIDRRSR
jgi:hypothetical protein